MNEKGYSLLETIIVTAMIGIIVTVIADLYVSGLKTFSEQAERTNLQTENRATINRLKNDLLQGYRIEPGWTDPDDGTTYTTSDTAVVIAVPAIDAESDWIHAGNAPVLDHIVYFLNDGKLYKRIETAVSDPSRRKNLGPIVESVNVSYLKFTYDQDPGTGLAKTVTVEMTLSKTVRNKNIDVSYKSTVNLRNK